MTQSPSLVILKNISVTSPFLGLLSSSDRPDYMGTPDWYGYTITRYQRLIKYIKATDEGSTLREKAQSPNHEIEFLRESIACLIRHSPLPSGNTENDVFSGSACMSVNESKVFTWTARLGNAVERVLQRLGQ